MAVRLIKKSWWVDFTFDYKRYRKRSPQNSRTSAQAYEASLRHRLARGEDIDEREARPESFQEFAARWFEIYVVPNNKPSEQYAKEKILSASLIPFFGKMLLGTIGAEHVERFKAKQKAAGMVNKTINNKLTVLSKCLKCAEEWCGTKMPTIRLLRCPTPKTDFLTHEECVRLLECAAGTDLEMLLLAMRTGMRQGEIRGLQWESIDWRNNVLTVRHTLYDATKTLGTPKNGRERHIPFDDSVRDLLRTRKQAEGYVFMNPVRNAPYTSAHILSRLAGVCKRAGVRRVGWHTLRHTFATQLTMGNVPITVVKELLGHSSITTTMRYAHVAPSALRSAIAMLSPLAANDNFGQPAGNQEAA